LPSEKCTADTLFDSASTAKTTTAAAVAILVDDENYPQFQWTTHVSELLPEDFVLPDPQVTKDVTLEDILSHRTGIPMHDESYFGVRARHPDDAKSITRNLRNLTFSKPLRTTFMYSNIMFTVATHVVETVTGMRYADFLRNKLWEPLGMRNTFHDLPDIEAHDAMARKATAYRWDKDTKQHIPAYASPEGQGAGCILTSPGDYAKWIRAMMKRAPPLSADAHKELVTPRTITPQEPKYHRPFTSHELYCLGIECKTYRGRTLVSHNGGIPGFKAKVSFLPEFDRAFLVYANLDTAHYVTEILHNTWMDEVLGVPKEERIDWLDFYRKWQERDNAEENENPPDLVAPEKPEPLAVRLEDIAGTYFDPGYKHIVLEIREGKLVADLDDRCFPSLLTFEHLTGNKFVIDNLDVWGMERRKQPGEIRVDGGRVVALGVGLEEDVEGGLIWFSRVLVVRAWALRGEADTTGCDHDVTFGAYGNEKYIGMRCTDAVSQ
jgi:CubicO group peptidase (beta-lactamase class C family)